jgi:hypothetical protein
MPTDPSPEVDPALARAWREVSGEEPPAHLDDAIRAAARRAVHAGPQSVRRSFAQRWRLPLSIAALVVVSASITLMISERDAHLPGAEGERSSAVRRLQAPAAPEAKLDQAKAGTAHEAPAAASPRPLAKSEEARVDRQAAPAAAPPPAPASAFREPDVAPAEPQAAPTPAPPEQESARVPAAPAEKDESMLRDEAAREAPQAPAAIAPGKRGVAGAPDANGTMLQKKQEHAIEPSPLQEAGSSLEESQPAGRARLKLQTRPALPAPPVASDDALHPEQWLDRIRELRRQGLTAEADASLERFRERYPDFALPADLAPAH